MEENDRPAAWHYPGVLVEVSIPLGYSLSDSKIGFNLLGFNFGFNNLQINRNFGLSFPLKTWT